MSQVTLLGIIIVFGIVALVVQLAFHFSRHLKRMSVDVSENLRQINDNLSLHLKDSLKLIHEANQNIGNRLDSATRVVGDVKEHLGKLEESNKQLYDIGKDISTLQDLLRAPKIRGGIGEYILEDLLKQILPREYYAVQYEFKNKERVDAAIRFGEGIVPVDAKFPLENFKRILETKDEKERISIKKNFITDIKNHIKKISEKYIVPDEGTFDFALMYIPAENVYYETIIKDEKIADESGIFQYAINRKVIPVSPNSFYAYLRVILLGLKGMSIEKSAKEILFNLQHLRSGFDKFATDFTKIGRHLDNAKSNYLESEKRFIKLTDKLTHIESLDKSEEKVKLTEK
jgi:DNA recombination protein RmuC